MIEISPEQVTSALRSLFKLHEPSVIRALAVLAGGNAGRILTDDPRHPRWALVWEADDGTLYRGGRCDREVLSQAVTLLRAEGVVALGFRDGDASVDLFPPDPDAGAECLEFDRPIGASDLTPCLGQLPAGYEMRYMDRALLERSPRREEKRNRFGGFENLLAKGIAVCILHQSNVVCEAYADMEVHGVREIGIATQEAYRKQGLATRACAQLIKLCEESGSAAYWDCARFNAGSVALARKLGFRNERAYKLLAWFKSKD